MSFIHKPNSGSALRNKNKKEPKHPDWKGDAMVNGKLMEVALWEGQTSGGLDRLSITFSEPRPKQDGGKSQGAPARESGSWAQKNPPPRRDAPPDDDLEPPPF